MTTRRSPINPRTPSLRPDSEPASLRTETPGGTTPLNVIFKDSFRPQSSALYTTIEAARELGFNILLQNRIDEETVVIDVTVYADRVTIEEGWTHTWWTCRDGWTLLYEGMTDDDDEVLDDPLWTQCAVRAIWVWIQTPGHDREGYEHDPFLTWFAEVSSMPVPRR